MYSAEPLPHFVDEYLSYLYEVHPTNATFDGVHLHDDLLEDWSRQAIESQTRDLGGFARRLAAIVRRPERPAPAWRSRGRLDRSGDRHRRLPRVPRTRTRPPQQGILPPRPRSLRTEDASRRGVGARRRSLAGDCHA